MKWHFAAILFLLILLGYCAADGMPMPSINYARDVFLPEQKAVIFWDGSQEQLVIESKITVEDITSVAWLIPIESSSKPVVEAADEQIFFDLSSLFLPGPKGRILRDFVIMAQGGDEGVEVVEQLKVDIYDVTILRATDADALIGWLNGNGYSFPSAFPNLLESYVQNGNIYFIANKINLQNKYPGIEPASRDFECAQEIAEQEYSSRWSYYPRHGFLEEFPYLADQYPEKCAGANAEAVSALVVLRLGIATPLKITFAPGRPFYPMLLSSLNTGPGIAKIYFVSGKPFKDDSGLFAVKNMLLASSSSLSAYGIKQGDTITLLSWENDYSTLGKDSFFSETAFVPELDPNFVPPVELILGTLISALFLLLAIALVSVPLLIVPFALGCAIARIFAEKRKKKSFFAQGNGLIAWLSSLAIALVLPLGFFAFTTLPTIFSDPEYFFSDPEFFFNFVSQGLFMVAFFSLPFFVSMALGLLFMRSGHKLRCLLGAVVFLLLYLALLFFLLMPIY